MLSYKSLSLFILCVLGAFSILEAKESLQHVKLHSQSAILMDAETGKILYQKNAFEKYPPASITKVATLVYALKKAKGEFNRYIEADWDCMGSISKAYSKKMQYNYPPHRIVLGGTHLNIHYQERFKIKDLMYGMMVVSANDAANMVAKYTAGAVSNFMVELNRYLKSIGCKNTNFRNPHGYHYPHHESTAYDMALVTCEGLKDPIFTQIFKTYEYELPPTNKQGAKKLVTYTKLIKPGSKYYYPFAIGAKTGYNDQSQNTLIAASKKKGKTLVVVLLKCPKSHLRYEDAILLFNEGFKSFK